MMMLMLGRLLTSLLVPEGGWRALALNFDIHDEMWMIDFRMWVDDISPHILLWHKPEYV